MQETARFCHRLGSVSVLTHGPQLDIDVLKVYNASARLVHHIISIQKILVRLILEAIKEPKTVIEMLRTERQDESV
jgi:hypothetical protein